MFERSHSTLLPSNWLSNRGSVLTPSGSSKINELIAPREYVGQQQGRFADGRSQCTRRIGPARQERAVASVSAKQLITTIAGQGDRNLLLGELRHQECCNRRRIRERLIEHRCDTVEYCLDVWLDDELRVLRSQFLGNDASCGGFVVLFLGESDGKRSHATLGMFRHQRDDRR